MLIVAQPKTGSTSLLDSVGEVTGLDYTQEFGLVRRLPKATLCSALRNSDMAEINIATMNRWTQLDLWRKQHLVPSENNLNLVELKLIEGRKFVITLRKPIDALEAIKRLPRFRLKRKLKVMLESLEAFNLRWREFAWGKDQILIVEFEDLIANQSEVVNRVLQHYGRDERVPDDFRLPKRRYTGGGAVKFRFR